jgi:hypothetical protein
MGENIKAVNKRVMLVLVIKHEVTQVIGRDEQVPST